MTEKNRGSAQVIEFSYVFPIVMVTVVALLYLVFLLFFHVYAFHVTEAAVETAVREVGGDRIYWQLSSHSLDEETKTRCAKEMEQKLKAMQVMPGLRFSSTFSENTTGSRVMASASCRWRGKQMFTVHSERTLRKPTEFASNVDLAEDISSDTGLRDFLKQKFGSYIDLQKTYGTR